MFLVKSAILLLLVFSLPYVHAEPPKKCSPVDTKRASLEASHLPDWKSFYISFKHYGYCDSPRLAEEYSYAISRLLAHHWDQVDLLLDLAAQDHEFKHFVLRHVDEDIPEEEAQLILNNSRRHCPVDGEWLCKAIIDY